MDGRVEGQADILTLDFFGSAVDGSIGDSNHTTAGAVGSLQVPPTAVWQVPVAQDEAKKQEAAKFDLIWVCLKIEIWLYDSVAIEFPRFKRIQAVHEW